MRYYRDMNRLSATLSRTLSKLREENRFRTLVPAGVSSQSIDFTSNDYLGFTSHPELRACALESLENGIELGAGGSRLLRGNNMAHEQLEIEAARFFGSEQALFFANGFAANHALMTALPAPRDVILFDSLIHASLRDGIQANPARHIRIPHNDLDAYEDALRQNSSAPCWVVVESVYSMDGDFAPLRDLHQLCKTYNAILIVDEAHATAVFGKQGKGLTFNLHDEAMITLHTCGKGLGVAGALVCASHTIIETLINKARSFIYSTAPMPLQAVLVRKALELCADADDRRARLFELCDMARRLLPAPPSPSPIIPYILGHEEQTCRIATSLQAKGFDIRAIRPPSVPVGTSRLRITVNALLRDEHIASLAAALDECT